MLKKALSDRVSEAGIANVSRSIGITRQGLYYLLNSDDITVTRLLQIAHAVDMDVRITF